MSPIKHCVGPTQSGSKCGTILRGEQDAHGCRFRSRRDSILSCAREHGVIRVRLFGSVPRGEATAASDVDFLVRYEPHRTLLDHIALGDALGALLQVPVDIVDETGLSPHIKDKILSEAVPL